MLEEGPQLNQIFKDGRVSHNDRSFQRELLHGPLKAVLPLGISHNNSFNSQPDHSGSLS